MKILIQVEVQDEHGIANNYLRFSETAEMKEHDFGTIADIFRRIHELLASFKKVR